MPTIENLDNKALRKAFTRLKRNTRQFQSLLVRDPTDFIDFEVQLKQQLETVTYELETGAYVPQKPVLHPYPKSKGINRPTVIFDVRDALVYRFCIEQLDEELISKTRGNPNIRGGIKISPNIDPSGDGYYEKFFRDWMEHNDAIREGLAERPIAASTDIASYFEGINITLLIDLVRSAVSGKPGVVTLLDFFLRNSKVQYDYGTNTDTGIPQEDIDCSRTLAYFYLHPHDDRLVKFTVDHDGALFRFADDITILVDSEAKGRRALKAVTDSLRELGLVASIEKTEIMRSSDVVEELMYAENEELDRLGAEITDAAKADEAAPALVEELGRLYAQWKDGPEGAKENWRKVLGRFYTLASLARAPFLVDDLVEHLVEYPAVVHDKLAKYLVRIQRDIDLGQIVGEILRYLDSEENLYPSLETALLESLLYLDRSMIPEEAQSAIGAYGHRLVLGEGREPLSAYARAVGSLLCFRFRRESLDEIADHYLRSPAGDGLFRKYLVFVSLAAPDSTRREKVLARARGEQNQSLNRLTGLIENLPTARKTAAVKSFLKRTSSTTSVSRCQRSTSRSAKRYSRS